MGFCFSLSIPYPLNMSEMGRRQFNFILNCLANIHICAHEIKQILTRTIKSLWQIQTFIQILRGNCTIRRLEIANFLIHFSNNFLWFWRRNKNHFTTFRQTTAKWQKIRLNFLVYILSIGYHGSFDLYKANWFQSTEANLGFYSVPFFILFSPDRC